MSSSFKSELLKEVSEQEDPVIRTDSIALKFKTQKETVVKTLLELKNEGQIFFLVKPVLRSSPVVLGGYKERWRCNCDLYHSSF